MQTLDRQQDVLTLGFKLRVLNWGLVLLLAIIAGTGTMLLYSAAGGDWAPWAARHAVRFAVLSGVMIVLALIDIRFYWQWSYVAYGASLVLLVAVEFMGTVGMGAQRWINVGVIVLQPSELTKITLVLAVARYFHGLTYEQVGRPLALIIPLLMVAAPVTLVLLQPNLGTALLLALGAGAVFLLAGVRFWKFVLVAVGGLSAIPLAWSFLHDYQKNRVLTFLDPSRDPLGAGYNIMQSQIAFGSGGYFGNGFVQGSQSQLRFLPEKETDFIFTVLGEEFGLIGTLALLGLFTLVLAYGAIIAVFAQSQYARLVAGGLTMSLFLYIFVNVAMVTGLIPVVGIPLPLVSNGGTAMLTVLSAVGILLSVSIHRDIRIPRVPDDVYS